MPEQSANAGPGSEYPRVGWGPSGLYKDGQKVSDVPLDEALAVNAAALGGPGSPLTDAELDSAARMWIESGHISVVRSKLIAEIRRLRAQMAGHAGRIASQSEALARAAEKHARGESFHFDAKGVTTAGEINAAIKAAQPLAWTKEPPTVPGWWWWRYAGSEACFVWVEPGGLVYSEDGCEGHTSCMSTSEWAGPIRPPS